MIKTSYLILFIMLFLLSCSTKKTVTNTPQLWEKIFVIKKSDFVKVELVKYKKFEQNIKIEQGTYKVKNYDGIEHYKRCVTKYYKDGKITKKEVCKKDGVNIIHYSDTGKIKEFKGLSKVKL